MAGRGGLSVAVALCVMGAAAPGFAASQAPGCHGFAVTILGTPGNDRIFGTPGRDVIDGGDGNDFIAGGAGRDVICGGAGDDRIHGNSGRDRLDGGAGTDLILAGSGRDLLRGGPGGDSMYGGPGADAILGGEGDDLLGGAGGPDGVRGGPGRDAIRGGEGRDWVRGGVGLDDCDGGPGIDTAAGCETPRNTEVGDRPPVRTHPGSRQVALTFDDGPDPRWTPQVLDVLAEYDVHGTFFVVGVKAARYPGLIRRMIREGHSVQNHTHSHGWLTRLSDAAAALEISAGRIDITAAAGGVEPRCLRPPFGAVSTRIRSISASEGQQIVMWDVDPQDWRYHASWYVASHVLRSTGGGDIVLFHDGGGPTAAASLPRIIQGLRDRGLEFTSICG